jgi:hypothetical protein
VAQDLEIHVVPLPDGRWGLRLARDAGVERAYLTRKAAIEASRRAGGKGAAVIVHDETGRISDRPGHGPHPQPVA